MFRITTIIVLSLCYSCLNDAQQVQETGNNSFTSIDDLFQLLESKAIFDLDSATLCEAPRRCVLYNQCLKDNTFNTKGIGEIILRFGGGDASNTILHGNDVYAMKVNRTIITKSGEEKSVCQFNERCCGESSITKPIDIVPRYDNTIGCGFSNPDGIDFKIMNPGKAQFGEYPWIVAVMWQHPDVNIPQLVGGGSLINPNVILTAAHILNDKKSSELKVRAGEWDTQSESEILHHQDRNVKKILIHEHFYEFHLFNDYALLILDQSFILDPHIQPICLPTANLDFDYYECFSAGWGTTEFLHPEYRQNILKKVNLPVVPFQRCQDTLRKTRLSNDFMLHNSFICAGGLAGKDTCFGDGGSPLMCPVYNQPNRYYQAGFVSWGVDCGLDGIPAVYAKVAFARDWIDSKMKELGYDDSSYKLN